MKRYFSYIFGLDLNFFTLIGLCFSSFSALNPDEVNTFEFLMPLVIPNAQENHLCMKFLVRDNFYLVGFEPRASTDLVHQMVLYGCAAPGSDDSVWSCSEAPGSVVNHDHSKTSPCRTGSQVIYGWSRGATASFLLPEHVGFHVGPDTPVQHLVLQVHYLRRYRDRTLVEIDNTGVILSYTKKRMARHAGVLLLGALGTIPARSVEHLETTCTIRENKTVHPFAFRAHTHNLGKVVSCYVVRQGVSGDAWVTLAKSNPARAQGFLPVRETAPLRRGDTLAARCTINNTTPFTVNVGNTERNEICNLYLVYWVEGAPLNRKYCVSPGAPGYYWRTAVQHFQNIPHLQASLL